MPQQHEVRGTATHVCCVPARNLRCAKIAKALESYYKEIV